MVKNEFIKKYFTCLSKIFICVAFAFLLVFSFGQKDLKKSFAFENNVIPYANELSGQTWVLNDVLYNNGIVTLDYPGRSFTINFTYNDISYTKFIIAYNSDTKIDVSFRNDNGITYIYHDEAWSYNSRDITFFDSTQDLTLLISWLEYNGHIYSPVVSYDITINLDNGIYGQTSASIEENSTLTLEYTIVNNGVFSGYVFDYGQNLITGDSGHGHISVSGNYEKITIVISDVTEDFEFTINSVIGRSLIGQWYLDYDLFIASGLISTDIYVVLARPFVSNDITYNRIFRTTNFNSFAYENTEDFELPVVNVFSFLNGLYLPVNTYNYLLVDIDYDENYINYVPDDYMFFNFFRLSTNEDIARVDLLNDQLVIQKENTNFVALFGAILDTQFGTLKSLLNFYIFDINLFSIFTFFLTLCLIFFVIKIVKGGKNNE